MSDSLEKPGFSKVNSLIKRFGIGFIMPLVAVSCSVNSNETAEKKTVETTNIVESVKKDFWELQARGTAENYLSVSAFSRKGLIDQLKFEGYSTEEATKAVDSLNVDWNEQAAKKAEEYLSISSFSKSGLIEQLNFEGFTDSQARYGVVSIGG